MKTDTKTVLITGANSGIGSAIRDILQQNGYTIFGIGRKNSEILCDLQDTMMLEKKVRELLKTTDINVLINCAGLGIFKPHEEISVNKMKRYL